jgi:hypothetical protein
MNTAAELRKQVESALAERIPAALSMRAAARPERVSCGVAEVDAALGGGFPQAALTELTGMDSSGRTALALSTLAEVTQRGESCAYVDVSDSLDPLSAAALGVDLRRLLWVRAGGMDGDAAMVAVADPTSANYGRYGAPGGEAAQNRAGQEKPPVRKGIGWCHPRSEALGLDHAIGELFHGAPGAARSYPGPNVSEESSDFTPRCSESIRRERPEPVIFRPQPGLDCHPPARLRPQPQKPWPRLDRSLRAVDLLLHTGGFRAIVLDMGEIDAEHARRVPPAMWYRFRLQAEKSQTLLLLLTRVSCAHSCAAVSLSCAGAKANWQRAAEGGPALLAGLSYCVRITRDVTRGAARDVTQQDVPRGAARGIDQNPALKPYRKKPAASAQILWSSTTSWLG